MVGKSCRKLHKNNLGYGEEYVMYMTPPSLKMDTVGNVLLRICVPANEIIESRARVLTHRMRPDDNIWPHFLF